MLDAPVVPRRLPAASLIAVIGGSFLIGIVAAWGAPQLDQAVNPLAKQPGLVSYLGIGLATLALTILLFVFGLRGWLPKTAVFVVAALGYNALLIAVKLGLGPLAIYVQDSFNRAHNLPPGQYGVDPGFQILDLPLAYPAVAAVSAGLYTTAFFLLYLIFRSGLQRRLGIPVRIEQRFVQLLVVMFVLAAVGGISILGLFGFLEYAVNALFGAVGLLIAVALVAAIALCSVAFKEAADQAQMTRNVTVLSTFAWIGLAFIAAYHILWLVFLLTLISLWPLKPYAYVSGAK